MNEDVLSVYDVPEGCRIVNIPIDSEGTMILDVLVDENDDVKRVFFNGMELPT